MLKTQQDRSQLQFFCLEAAVATDSTVRVVDAFVDALDLEQLGFVIKGKVNNGAPAFHTADLLKLYFYGYLNRTRSSRRLQREAFATAYFLMAQSRWKGEICLLSSIFEVLMSSWVVFSQTAVRAN